MAHGRKALRELRAVIEPLGFEHVGYTRKGHTKFVHRATGRILTTVSEVKDHRAIDNTIRSAKHLLRRIQNDQ